MNRFFEEYWMFAEAMLERCADVLGVGLLNQAAAALGYPFGAALALSGAGSCRNTRRLPDFGLAAQEPQAFARKISCSAVNSTGLVRWWSKPTAAVRARSCTWP